MKIESTKISIGFFVVFCLYSSYLFLLCLQLYFSFFFRFLAFVFAFSLFLFPTLASTLHFYLIFASYFISLSHFRFNYVFFSRIHFNFFFISLHVCNIPISNLKYIEIWFATTTMLFNITEWSPCIMENEVLTVNDWCLSFSFYFNLRF